MNMTRDDCLTGRPGWRQVSSPGLLLLLLCVPPSFGCRFETPAPRTREAAKELSTATDSKPGTSTIAEPPLSIVSGLALVEVEVELGLKHIFITDGRGEQLAVETLGGGCGWIDYDRDGAWDLVLNQGGQPDAKDRRQAPIDELSRQWDGRFVSVARQARFTDADFSQAVAIGDFDDDGFQDIYICNVFENTLWMNQGDGTFIEVAASGGVNDRRWSSSAAWADLNADGLLDLYVCNYLQYDPTNPKDCRDPQGRKTLCNPASLPPWPNACFINQGDGRFIDETSQRGLASPPARSLGIAVVDLNGDDLPDIYVANDTDDNHLFINRGDGTFDENAVLLGCATDYLGVRQGSMGIAVNDFDDNGYQDLYVTHYFNESNTLYVNLGKHGFQDSTNILGLHLPTLPLLGFGTVMQDLDHRGRMQLFVANGHVIRAPHEPEERMPAQIFQFERRRNGTWVDIGRSSGDYFQKKFLGRGVATADFDGDGDLDLLVLNLDDPASLLRNESQRGNWINFSFLGRSSNRFGIGVRVELSGVQRRVQQLCGGTSFAATHQPLLSFGLGEETGPIDAVVVWPSGVRQQLTGLLINDHYRVEEPRSGGSSESPIVETISPRRINPLSDSNSGVSVSSPQLGDGRS
jgi:enediyne biosynthesis protein E4